MNMKTALRKLYKAASGGEDNYKNNISKLLVDIHYAITGKECDNKNNHAKIISELADNWPEGGGGGGDFETASVTFVCTNPSWGYNASVPICDDDIPAFSVSDIIVTDPVTVKVPMYKGEARFPLMAVVGTTGVPTASGGVAVSIEEFSFIVTGDGTITATAQEYD